MRSKARFHFMLMVPLMLMALFVAVPAQAGAVGGSIELGTVAVEETLGDPSTVAETFDIYDGLTLSRINLEGRAGGRSAFNLDLRDVNQNSVRGMFNWRMTDLGSLSVRHNRSRQIYDALGEVSSERRDWKIGAHFTPSPSFRLTADYGLQDRTGDRLSLPLGTASALGTGFDYALKTHVVEGEFRRHGRMFAVGWEGSRLEHGNATAFDRQGNVVSARASLPCLLVPGRVSHFVRGSYGTQELTQADLEYTTSNFQYLAMVKAARDVDFRYRLDLSRIESDATGLQTDRTRNDFDLTWRHNKGSIFGGYGYATTDDDRTLTDTNTWRLGGAFNDGDRIQLRASYASSVKNDQDYQDDQESLTLLKDVETSRWRASAQTRLADPVTLGLTYLERHRDYPVLGVSATGKRYGAFSRLSVAGWGTASLEYSYSSDEYVDRIAYPHGAPDVDGESRFDADNHTITARVDYTGVSHLKLAGGVTYLDLGKDIDVEKSILMLEGQYDLNRDYFVAVKYNVYNYDDYILVDRYFTTNVVRLNVGYRFPVN